MGIIVDANIALKFFFDGKESEFMAAYNAIVNGQCCLHYGRIPKTLKSVENNIAT